MKIFWAVICANAIDVMDNFIRPQRAANDLFHDESMLCNLSGSSTGKVDISIAGNVFASLPSARVFTHLVNAPAFTRTVVTIAAFNLLLICEKGLAAHLTYSRDHAFDLRHGDTSEMKIAPQGRRLIAEVKPNQTLWGDRPTNKNRLPIRLFDFSKSIIPRTVNLLNWLGVAGGMAVLHLWLEK